MSRPALAIVSSETLAPPYPADTRAKGWRFEIDYERIEQSDTWVLAPPAMRPWLLMLWLTAWRQVPCGSLPADDDLIAARIGIDRRQFIAHRDILMRGWQKATDGRLYHNHITEIVLRLVGLRIAEAERKAKYRNDQKQTLNTECPTGQTPDGRWSPTVATLPEPEPVPEPEVKTKDKSLMSGKPDDAQLEKPKNGTPSPMPDALAILEFLNKVTGRRYRPVKANTNMIIGRLREGYSVPDLKAMIATKANNWKHDDKMNQYLRPSTLFNATNCAQYIAEI